MKEGNPCIASGCPGLCCQNIDLELTNPERKEFFPRAQKVSTFKDLAWFKKNKVSGLYYLSDYQRSGLEFPDFNLMIINGACPHRLPDGGCAIHAEREHVAKNFKIGSFDCNEIRKENGLGPIFIEPVE